VWRIEWVEKNAKKGAVFLEIYMFCDDEKINATFQHRKRHTHTYICIISIIYLHRRGSDLKTTVHGHVYFLSRPRVEATVVAS
jgi:hypothetical protein